MAFLALAKPVSADDSLVSQQQRVTEELAAAAASVSQLDLQIAGLDRSIEDTGRRVQRERQQLRLIARAMYAQPESALMALLGGNSLADALTRLSDLTAAGDRATLTKGALDQDLSSLQAQRVTLGVDRQKADGQRQQLDVQFRTLQSLIAAATAQTEAAPRPPSGPSPSAAAPPTSPPTPPPPTGASSIQQIILDAFAPLGAAAQSWALRVAKCESGFNPLAVNRASGASGLFQFMPSTWANTPQGKAGRSVFDAVANAQAAAWYYKATGQTGSPWSCK